MFSLFTRRQTVDAVEWVSLSAARPLKNVEMGIHQKNKLYLVLALTLHINGVMISHMAASTQLWLSFTVLGNFIVQEYYMTIH